MQPPTVSGAEDKDGEGASESGAEQSSSKESKPSGSVFSPSETEDKEVAEWVKDALDRRQRGLLGVAEKPPLHAVALDAVPGSPLLDDPTTFSPP